MSSSFLRGLRISIAVLSFSVGILFIPYHPILSWQAICQMAITVVVFFTYVYAIQSKQVVHKFLRAFLLFALSVFWLYLYFKNILLRVQTQTPYICRNGNYLCALSRATEALSVACGFFILLDIAVTLQNGPLHKQQVQPQDVVIVSPIQPMQQQFPQPYPGAYYPQQPQQLPYPVMQQPPQQKFETQEQLYQRHQMDLQKQPVGGHQSFYQPRPVQQQQFYQGQHSYSAAGYVAITPKEPGTTVTSTPQPGVPPVVPYPSPINSVAVSPVMPVTEYSSA
ncbi:hypothetical protein EDD21DRAFT_140610 [Dissophora ornata]|nr:hypothetical protein EDD21DRAFT_140610 [Dissophora ornata]